ncbi:hypothetical protein C2G38_2032225 [Gigaspora rosea]|uniref:Uncharacterized protein n=1 Tax=Gigaspora rosea TaxID=44941 RepID=A0A397VNB5_9GLOM|nr:hypothetical protein C2G38_2032225 [Gigaspora rosea]
MVNKKSSTTTSNKKERIKTTIKSIVASKDTKKNAVETKNKSTLELNNNNKRSETKQKNGSNESDEKIIIEKPLVDKPLDDSKKSSKKATKADESNNNNNPSSIKPEQNITIKKRLSVAPISSSSSSVTPTSNAETKNNIADNKRRTSSVVRSETSSRPSTPDIKRQRSSKISQHPSRPTTPDITKRPSSSRLTVYENSTPDVTRKASSRSSSSAAKRPTSIISNTNLSTNSRPASPEFSKTAKRSTSIISSTNSRSASPELLKTTKRPTSTKSSTTNSNTNSRPNSPELLKTTKRPTSTKSSTTNSNTNSRSTSPELLKTTKRPTSIISKSSTNSRSASPELLKTTKRPTSMISVTNSQPVMPEVKVKQSSSTQPNDSSNIINKSKQLSQQIPPTQVIKKQSFSQSSRPPSPEITKLSEPPLISGKSNTSKPSRPSTPDITKSSINETTRKRSVSRPSTFEIQQLPELTRRQRSYSTTQMSFATTFNSINTNSTLNSQIQNNRRTSFTSSIASQISDDSYFQRPSTPTSETSVENVNNNNDHEKTNNEQLFTEKWVDENSNLFSDTTNDKICLVIDKKSTEINNFMHEDINQPKNRLVVFDSEQEITPAKTCISKLNLSDNLTVIETSSLEHETDISNDKIFNNDNSILSDNDNHKNELQQGEKDNLIQENNQNIDIKGSIEILDESSKEVKTETKIDKINAVELINNMMENDKTIKNVKNVIEVNGNKLPAIIEQDLDLEHQSIEKIIINSINQHDHMVFTPTKIETEEKHNLNLTEMAMNYEKSNIVEDCAIKQQNFSNINLLGQEQISQDNHIKNNNTLNDNICVMQNNINNIYNINNQECIPYLPSEPAIIEHGTISVYADPYKKYVGSYGTTPQDFSPFTNYETQDIIMRVDEKRFDEVMRQNLLVPSEIGYKESTVTNLLKEPNLSTENLLNSIDSITKEQQYYDVSISEDESLDSKYKMKRPSYGTFPDLCSYSNSVKSLHLGQKDEQSTFSSLCSCPIC